MKASRLRAGVLRHKAPAFACLLPLVFSVHYAAALALIQHLTLRVVLVKHHIGPHKRLVMPALRAWHVPFLPRGLVELRLDAALSLNDRRGHDHRLFVPKGRLSLLGQGKRVALRSGAGRIAVNLVRQQHLDGTAGKARCAVRAHDGDVATGEILLHDGVAGIAAFHVDLVPQLRRVPYHGREPVFGKGLSHVQRRLHHEDGSRGVVHVVAQRIEDESVGLADLRRAHDHHLADVRVADCVHDLPLVWCLVRVPAPRLRAALRRQHPVSVCPLRKRQSRGRFQHRRAPCQQLQRRLWQINELSLFHRSASPAASSAHILFSRSWGTYTAPCPRWSAPATRTRYMGVSFSASPSSSPSSAAKATR